MISSLRAQNFKSWRDTGTLRFSNLTGFFGSNSSGKTSLIQLLLLLKQTVDSPDRNQVLELGTDRTLVELGTFEDIVFEHDVQMRQLEIELAWRAEDSVEIQDPRKKHKVLSSSQDLTFHTSVRARRTRLAVDSMTHSIGKDRFTLERTKKQGEYELRHEGPTRFEFVRARGRKWALPHPVKCYGFPDQVRGYFQNAGFLSDSELAFEKLFHNVYYLGPLREYPQRQYSWSGARPADMGRRGERAVDALLASRHAEEKISRGRGYKQLTVEKYAAFWLRELGVIHDFTVRQLSGNLYEVRVRRSPSAPEVLLTDVGFGVSQLLPVLVLCYFAPPKSTLILEQPEIHLHPSVQAGLADVFIDAIQKRDIQIVLESHSEYLLKRLQRRIAEIERPYDSFTEDDVALYFCSNEGGESRARELEVDSYGNIVNWPQDFFGDEMADLAARTRAAAKRKKAAR